MDVENLSSITVNEDSSTEDIFEILKFVKPSWKREDTQMEMLSGGNSCLTFKCQNKNDADDAITIRARNKVAHLPINDHFFEEKVLKTMSDLSYFPKLHGIFKNGYCYTYIHGRPADSMTSPPLKISEVQLRCIARKMADIHNVKVVDVDYSETNYFIRLRKCLDEFYPRNEEGFPKYEDLKTALDFLEEKISNRGYVIGLCHGDTHLGNIVWNEENESATFVDWEMTHIGYQLNDLAYFLIFAELDDTIFPFPKEIPDNLRRKFLRYYLEKAAENDGRLAAEVTDDSIDSMEKPTLIFKMVITE